LANALIVSKRPGSGFVFQKLLRSGLNIFVRKTRAWCRRWCREVQGLVATNPEGDFEMDVVGVVPSVPFEPETDLYG
jgi:hypothetical protein